MKIEFPLKTKNPVNGSRGGLIRSKSGKVFNIHAAQAKRIRARTHVALLTSGAKKPGPLFVVRLTRISPGTLDDDNLRPTLKAVRDAVAAWLGLDDGGQLAKWEYAQEKGEAGVRIEVAPVASLSTIKDGMDALAFGSVGLLGVEETG